ncbi:hypothetical protein ACJOWW_05620 [Acinetobacter baumannii]|nr:hypothetical protein [Acinetobacter baumannii]HEM7757398.1 hypothetical protein [Acinetobacter baumannii]
MSDNVTQEKLSHPQNLFSVSFFKKYCKYIIFINYGQAVDEI